MHVPLLLNLVLVLFISEGELFCFLYYAIFTLSVYLVHEKLSRNSKFRLFIFISFLFSFNSAYSIALNIIMILFISDIKFLTLFYSVSLSIDLQKLGSYLKFTCIFDIDIALCFRFIGININL